MKGRGDQVRTKTLLFTYTLTLLHRETVSQCHSEAVAEESLMSIKLKKLDSSLRSE